MQGVVGNARKIGGEAVENPPVVYCGLKNRAEGATKERFFCRCGIFIGGKVEGSMHRAPCRCVEYSVENPARIGRVHTCLET